MAKFGRGPERSSTYLGSIFRGHGEKEEIKVQGYSYLSLPSHGAADSSVTYHYLGFGLILSGDLINY